DLRDAVGTGRQSRGPRRDFGGREGGGFRPREDRGSRDFGGREGGGFRPREDRAPREGGEESSFRPRARADRGWGNRGGDES
ncbi:MAG: hypothetical protein Q4C67_02575, partial [Deinococcus sp.]|nr:hypothetical protein [Deinococcus sp.]